MGSIGRRLREEDRREQGADKQEGRVSVFGGMLHGPVQGLDGRVDQQGALFLFTEPAALEQFVDPFGRPPEAAIAASA